MKDKLNALIVIEELRNKGIEVWEQEGKIKYKASIGVMQPKDIENLKKYKQEIIEILIEENKPIEVNNNVEERFEPFELTDVQQAYLMGRNNLFDYGDVACHIYLQLNYDKLDIDRVEKVWRYIIDKHEMLRAVIYEDGYQRILKDVPEFKVKDYGTRDADEVMQEIGHSKYTIGQWPYFSVGVSEKDNKSIMHFSIEFIIADWTSIWTILSQFEGLYYGEIASLPDYKLSFRDYVIAEKAIRETKNYKIDKEYWLQRVDDLYEAPKLPINKYQKDEKAEFERKYFQIPYDKWNRIKDNALKNSITPTTLVLMAYASVLERWSTNKKFSLNLTVLNRLPIHKEVNEIVGDFTSVNILEVDLDNNNNFIENARKVNSRLFEDLDHRLFSGVEVMREIARKRSKEEAFMPYVFTSAIGLLSSTDIGNLKGMTTGIGISQTPQVFIDCQVMDGTFGMQVDWDIRKGVFEEEMIQDMFDSFKELVNSFSDSEVLENYKELLLPQKQQDIFREVNNTTRELPKHLLHEDILKQGVKNPNKIAVISDDQEISYGELLNISYGIYLELINNNCKEGDNVAIIMEKSIYQVASAIAVLCAKAVYVPITIEQGFNRTKNILDKIESEIILTTSNNDICYEDIKVINVDGVSPQAEELPRGGDADKLAYIIFTSGSTGEPKGVAITHRAAVNTIEDINLRYHVTEKDSILGVSEFNFDLSVYDIFGILSVGGTLVYPKENKKRDPAYLAQLIKMEKITVWNSVPALLQMIMLYSGSDEKCDLSSLKLVLLSGDWIPINLPDELLLKAPDANVVSLGGATEASIWSIHYDYEGINEEYNSIPYGKPLWNQEFRILDSKLQNCPIGVAGELYITGDGLAQGYYNDKEKTEAQFIMNEKENIMMYRTGDIGRYHKDGNIEFIGRIDNQIKLNGHRIELGEIESVINKHPNIVNCAVIHNEKSLYCFFESKFIDNEGKKMQLNVKELKDFIKEYLPIYMIPKQYCELAELPITMNGKINRKALKELIDSKDIQVDEDIRNIDNMTELQQSIAKIWSDVGISDLGLTDNFYDCGADSLIMAQVTGKLREEIAADIPFDTLLRQILNYPTIEKVAEFIEEQLGDTTVEIIQEDRNIGVSKIYSSGEGPLRIVFHAALGTMNCFRLLIPHLIEQNKGDIMTIAIDDSEEYYNMDPNIAVQKLADDYTKLILETGAKNVQLIGYCYGGWLAVETANRLQEKGVEIDDMVLIDCQTVPWIIKDDLLIEILFVPNLFVEFSQIGFGEDDDIEQVFLEIIEQNGYVPENATIELRGNKTLDKIGNIFRELSEKTIEERFELYTELAYKNTGSRMDPKMALGMFRSFAQTIKAVHGEMEPYVGDIRYLIAKDFAGMFYDSEKNISYWKELCIGEFLIDEVDGNHYTCIETEPNATNLAKKIGEFE